MILRDWEKYWRDYAPKDFLRKRSPRTVKDRAPMFEMVAEMASEVGSSALDIGCASCVLYTPLKERGVKYTGLDLTEKFLEYAKELHPEIDVKAGNIVDPPFQSCSFDTVVCINTFTNFHPGEYVDILNQMIRLARKQVIIVFEKEPWSKPMVSEKLEHYYRLRYNREDLIKIIRHNEKVKDLEIMPIKDGREIRSETLYRIIV